MGYRMSSVFVDLSDLKISSVFERPAIAELISSSAVAGRSRRWTCYSVASAQKVGTCAPPNIPRPPPHSPSSAPSSSDSDVASLVATPCFWAARGRLALGLGVVVVRLRTFLVVLAETRFGSVPVTHREHMARCSLFHSFFWNPSCSLRTLHFRHSLHYMTARTH